MNIRKACPWAVICLFERLLAFPRPQPPPLGVSGVSGHSQVQRVQQSHGRTVAAPTLCDVSCPTMVCGLAQWVVPAESSDSSDRGRQQISSAVGQLVP